MEYLLSSIKKNLTHLSNQNLLSGWIRMFKWLFLMQKFLFHIDDHEFLWVISF